nr:MAG TPA: CRISPR associated protein [Caudoviricetes sp.]
MTKTASTLSKVADVAGDIAKVADAVDPANLVMKGIGKGVSYGAGSIKKGIQKLDL